MKKLALIIIVILLTSMVSQVIAQSGANFVVQAKAGKTMLYQSAGTGPKGELQNGREVTVAAEVSGNNGYAYYKLSEPEGYALKADLIPINNSPAPAQPSNSWVLPTKPQDLPDSLPAGVANDEADMPACQSRMDMSESCSTLEGQAVEGDFVIGDPATRPMLRLMNGDVLEVTDSSGNPIYTRIPKDTSSVKHDMVLLYAAKGASPVTVHVKADWGSNRENFYAAFPRQEFSDQDVTDVLAHQLRLVLVNSEPANDACQPGVSDCYPEFINPRNCASVNDSGAIVTYCDAINIYVLQWDGTQWTTKMYGVYGLLRDDATGEATEGAYLNLLP